MEQQDLTVGEVTQIAGDFENRVEIVGVFVLLNFLCFIQFILMSFYFSLHDALMVFVVEDGIPCHDYVHRGWCPCREESG